MSNHLDELCDCDMFRAVLWSSLSLDNEVHLKGLCEEDATVPPVGAAVPLSHPHQAFLFPDDGGRALHLCSLHSAVLLRGALRCPLILLLVCLLLLVGFGHHCHVTGAEDNFCLGHLPVCIPPHPHRTMLPYSARPLPEYANLHLGRRP